MGAALSAQPKTSKDLTKAVDFIASNYIVTQGFEDMKNLAAPEYCEKLVILTSKVIASDLTNEELHYLSRRVEDGMEINEMETDKVIYAKRRALDDLDVRAGPEKDRMCIGIARFYVQVAHLFAAIATTVNVRYRYVDATGIQRVDGIQGRDGFPMGARPELATGTMCDKRYNALVNGKNFDVASSASVTVAPDFCGLSFDSARGREREFTSEPGVPELEALYFDKYNYATGKFDGMTEKTRRGAYSKDLLTFYQAFTGRKAIPKNEKGENAITSFSQIPLKDFHKSQGCAPQGAFRDSYKGTLKDKLFRAYADNAAALLRNARSAQGELIEVLDALFTLRVNAGTGRNEVVVNTKLNADALDKLTQKTRSVITQMYAQCETDFGKGVQIFESIVGKQMLDTAKERDAALQADIMEQQYVEGAPSSSDEQSLIDGEKDAGEQQGPPGDPHDQQNENAAQTEAAQMDAAQPSAAHTDAAQPPAAQTEAAQPPAAQTEVEKDRALEQLPNQLPGQDPRQVVGQQEDGAQGELEAALGSVGILPQVLDPSLWGPTQSVSGQTRGADDPLTGHPVAVAALAQPARKTALVQRLQEELTPATAPAGEIIGGGVIRRW